MVFHVKITTKHKLLDLITPVYCRGCGKVGEIFCDCCKKDFLNLEDNFCPNCHKKVEGWLCEECELPLDGVWMCGYRDEKLGQIVEEYKYHSVRVLGTQFMAILNAKLPRLEGEVVVVPLPTIRRHIRERGFDHTFEIAKLLAAKRKWQVEQIIVRDKNTTQVGADARQRQKQAEKAYRMDDEIDSNKTYLLIDDVWTTGSSMKAAAILLRKNGAKKVFGAVLVANR